jgi:hypothetical protein
MADTVGKKKNKIKLESTKSGKEMREIVGILTGLVNPYLILNISFN